MELTNRLRTFFVSVGLAALLAPATLAVPYASGVRNTGGTNWEFVLNEAADSIAISRDGGNAINILTPAAGRYTFDLESFADFEIDVAKNASAGWTTISDTANLFTNFERPNGIVINNNPASPYFGTIYVNSGTNLATASGRTMGDGIYSLTADMKGVDLANDFALVTDPNDATQAKIGAGWSVDTGTSSAWRIALDEAGNIIASDWSDTAGGAKYIGPDLTGGGLILKNQDGVTPLLLNDENEEVHGSIVSTPYVTGSVGNNLTLYGVDEDFDLDGDTLTATSGNHVWKWNVGNIVDTDGSGGYDQPPELVINANPLATANSDGSAAFLNLNVGVLADAIYSPVHDKWYVTQPRNDGNESAIAVVTADSVDGMNPTLEWSSKQFSIDNNLDGFTDVSTPLGPVTQSVGIQDIFREAGSSVISPDGTKLFVHRSFVYGDAVIANPGDPVEDQVPNDNPHLGRESNVPGSILVIPLDENGLPDIQVDDNGTPDDSSDDFLANVESITITDNDGNDHSRHSIVFDAAGNFYITNNISELIEVFSPGGNTIATTTSAGVFSVETLAGGMPGDFDGNGIVDAADYTEWKNAFGDTVAPGSGADGNSDGIVDAADYTVWRDHLTEGGSGLGSGAVPEPGTLALVMMGVLALGCAPRRHC